MTEPADRRILFAGDSFVAGVGDPTGLGWVGRVVAACHAAGRPLTAYNLGVRGDTSAQVAARWAVEARARMAAADASYGIVFALGTNDATHEHGRARVEPTRSVGTLGRMIAAACTAGLDVFVVGPPPAGERAQDDRVCLLSRRFAELASARGVPFVETAAVLRATRAWTAEAAAGDGAHPGAAGYAVLASIVLGGGFLDWLR